MSELEKQTRKLAKYNFIRLRNICDGVRAYLPNGIEKVTFKDWTEAHDFILNYKS